jgi:hypothetical protein
MRGPRAVAAGSRGPGAAAAAAAAAAAGGAAASFVGAGDDDGCWLNVPTAFIGQRVGLIVVCKPCRHSAGSACSRGSEDHCRVGSCALEPDKLP